MKSSLFNEAALKTVEAKVHEAEKQTSGEIVVLVVPSSGEYRWVRWMWAALGAVLATVVLWWLQRDSSWTFTLLQIAEAQVCAALVASLIPLWHPVRRFSLSKSLVAERVHRECLANFTALGLHETRDRTGILIYLSELEHRVEILADKGINEKVGPDFWKDQVGNIVTGIRTGRPTESLCDTVEEMGRKLTQFFPRKPDDTNELPNEVRVGHHSPKHDPLDPRG